jgi:hypothetical protein
MPGVRISSNFGGDVLGDDMWPISNEVDAMPYRSKAGEPRANWSELPFEIGKGRGRRWLFRTPGETDTMTP